MNELEKLQKEIEKLKSENSKLKSDKKNLEHRVRNMKLAQKVAESKLVFSDGDKLMIMESIVLTVIRSIAPIEALAQLIARFHDDDFWREHKNSEVKKIIALLLKK